MPGFAESSCWVFENRMHTELMLGFYTMLTSTLAGMMGLGGGTLLIAIMPIYLSGNLIFMSPAYYRRVT